MWSVFLVKQALDPANVVRQAVATAQNLRMGADPLKAIPRKYLSRGSGQSLISKVPGKSQRTLSGRWATGAAGGEAKMMPREMREDLKKYLEVKPTPAVSDPEEEVRMLLNRNLKPFRAVQSLGDLLEKTKSPMNYAPGFDEIRQGILNERAKYEKILLGRK